MVAHCRPSRQPNSFEHSVTSGRKKGKEKERKTKGGAAQAPAKPKGGEARARAPQGGARARTLSGWAKSPDVGSGQGDSHTTL